MEIKKLVEIERSPVLAKALEEWTRRKTVLESRKEFLTQMISSLKDEIYQLIGFFSVFQGVLLTTVSGSNLLHCNNWWSPIFLSLFASVVAVAGVIQKLLQMGDVRSYIDSDQDGLKDLVE